MNEQIEKIVNELHSLILTTWSDADKNEFFLSPWRGENLHQYHHSLGRHIRNHYKLWTIPWTPEIVDGYDNSPYHPDAVSMTILTEVWKKGSKNE